MVTRHHEYNNVPRTVLEVFSPYLATLLSSINSPEETPTIIFPEVKSVTLKHLMDLLQHGAIQLNGPTEKRRETILEIVELANILNIEMNNLSFDEEDSVPDRSKQEPVNRKTDLSDELLLFEENLFCQQFLKKEYFETEQPTGTNTEENMVVEQVKQENTTEEYFENLTIEDPQVKTEDQERKGNELENTNAGREEGELSEEDEEDAEVFTLHCRRCRFGCSSRKELEKHRAWYHREERRESRSPATFKRSRYSTSSSSSHQKYSSSGVSPYKHKQMKYQHNRYKTLDFRTRFHQ